METLKPAWVLIKYMDFCDSHIDSIMLLVQATHIVFFFRKVCSVKQFHFENCKVDDDGDEQRNRGSLRFLSGCSRVNSNWWLIGLLCHWICRVEGNLSTYLIFKCSRSFSPQHFVKDKREYEYTLRFRSGIPCKLHQSDSAPLSCRCTLRSE